MKFRFNKCLRVRLKQGYQEIKVQRKRRLVHWYCDGSCNVGIVGSNLVGPYFNGLCWYFLCCENSYTYCVVLLRSGTQVFSKNPKVCDMEYYRIAYIFNVFRRTFGSWLYRFYQNFRGNQGYDSTSN